MSEEHERERKEILKQREIDAIKRAGLPYLRAGMSHKAVAVELRRAANRAKVRANILKSWEEERRQQPEPIGPAEGAARALFGALDSGGEQRKRAEEFLKTAHPRIKAKMLEIAGVTSDYKERRSNQRNGF